MLLLLLNGKVILGKILSISLLLRIMEVFAMKLKVSLFLLSLFSGTPNNSPCQETREFEIPCILFYLFT